MPTIISLSFNEALTFFVKNAGESFCISDSEGKAISFDSFTLKGPQKLTGIISKKYISKVCCGLSHTVFLSHSGMVFTIGMNDKGQLGLGENVNGNNEPAIMNSLVDYKINDLFVGKNHTIVYGTLRDSSKIGKGATQSKDAKPNYIFAWGDNSFGQLGLNQNKKQIPTPTLITTFEGRNSPEKPELEGTIVGITGGLNTSFVLFDDGSLYGFGNNAYKQICGEETKAFNYPYLINFPFLKEKDAKIVDLLGAANSSLFISDKSFMILQGAITNGETKLVNINYYGDDVLPYVSDKKVVFFYFNKNKKNIFDDKVEVYKKSKEAAKEEAMQKLINESARKESQRMSKINQKKPQGQQESSGGSSLNTSMNSGKGIGLNSGQLGRGSKTDIHSILNVKGGGLLKSQSQMDIGGESEKKGAVKLTSTPINRTNTNIDMKNIPNSNTIMRTKSQMDLGSDKKMTNTNPNENSERLRGGKKPSENERYKDIKTDSSIPVSEQIKSSPKGINKPTNYQEFKKGIEMNKEGPSHQKSMTENIGIAKIRKLEDKESEENLVDLNMSSNSLIEEIFKELIAPPPKTVVKLNKKLREDPSVYQNLIDNWNSRKKDPSVKNLFYNGIPSQFRSKLWLLLIKNKFCVSKAYFDIQLSKVEKDKNKIKLPFPYLGLFKEENPLSSDLRDIVSAFYVARPDIKPNDYLSNIAGIFLINMDKFQSFVAFVNLILPRSLICFYLENKAGGKIEKDINERVQIFRQIFFSNLPELCGFMESNEIFPEDYFVEWMMSLFTSAFNIDLVMRIWDVFFIEGLKTLFAASVAILKYFQDKIMTLDYEDILELLHCCQEVKVDEDIIIDYIRKIKIPKWVEEEIQKLETYY
ncbi:MAG: hypothetical protein MJ252_01390 [archaeon]|nr:hypothetical protein [archaeon]